MQHRRDAAAAGQNTLANERGHVAAHDAAPETLDNEHADSPAVGRSGKDQKEFATLRALLALQGYTLHERSTGGYVVSRWNLDRALPDLAAVRSFAERVGAA